MYFLLLIPPKVIINSFLPTKYTEVENRTISLQQGRLQKKTHHCKINTFIAHRRNVKIIIISQK